MVTETEIFNNLEEARIAKKRGGIRHSNGFHALHTDFMQGGKVKITWNNDPPPPPTPDEIEKEQLRQDLQNETIGLPQLIRYLKLIGI